MDEEERAIELAKLQERVRELTENSARLDDIKYLEELNLQLADYLIGKIAFINKVARDAHIILNHNPQLFHLMDEIKAQVGEIRTMFGGIYPDDSGK